MSTNKIPPLIMTSDPGSFAHRTIAERKPQIIQMVLQENRYPAEIEHNLNGFEQEILNGDIQPPGDDGPDLNFWSAHWQPYRGRSWFDLPWFFAEAYFYRRLLGLVGYFQKDSTGLAGHDPFQSQKERQILADIPVFAGLFDHFLDLALAEEFEMLVLSSLWSNRVDLSHFSLAMDAAGGHSAVAEKHLLLVDHIDLTWELLQKRLERIDVINDNAGMDILFDLALADFLIRHDFAGRIHFHLKIQPFFVSDAMIRDADFIIDALTKAPQQPTSELGRRLAEYRQNGALQFEADPFWTTCLGYRDLPNHLLDWFAASELTILKGDVNYRRMLDDRHWPPETPFEIAAAPFPQPFVHLRTLKSEIVAGLAPGQASVLSQQDPEWLVNGRRGLIQGVFIRK